MAFKYSNEELEYIATKIAPYLDELLNPTEVGDDQRPHKAREIGFALVVFEFGPPGCPLSFVTNANVEDTRKALRELDSRLEEVGHVVKP